MKKASKDQDLKFTDQDFDLFPALAALDRKDYKYFETLTQEQRQKFVPYMLLHWASTVSGNSLLSAYYVMSCDANANKHMFNENIQHHPELQWLMLCSVSPGNGKQYHKWLPQLKNNIVNLSTPAKIREVQEYFQKIYPNAAEQELTELASFYTQEQNIKHRLAQIYPDMKISDIEILSKFVNSQDLDEYDRQSGN